MPFDGTNVSSEVLLLDKMIALLSDPTRWCKGAMVRFAPGGLDRYCVLGALALADGADPERGGSVWSGPARNVLRRLNSGPPIVLFNDALDTTHADIMGHLSRVRATAIRETGHAI